MGKRAKEVLKKAGGKREFTQSVVIAVVTVLASLTLVFVIYPEALNSIADGFRGFQVWILGIFGL